MRDPGDPADVVQAEMTRRGFLPARTYDGQRVGLILRHCPFAEVAAADPGTVCTLHIGLAEGLAEGLGGLAVEDLVTKDSHEAGCLLAMRRT